MAKIPENSKDIELWLKLIRADEVGPVTFGRLLQRFGSVDRVLGASVNEMTKVEGIGFKTAERIAASRDKFDACAELELADKLGVWILHMEDPRYPAMLKQIYDPPPVLYVKGTLAREDTLGVAIVGWRGAASTARSRRRDLPICSRRPDSRSSRAWPAGSTPPLTAGPWPPRAGPLRCRVAACPASSRRRTPSSSI